MTCSLVAAFLYLLTYRPTATAPPPRPVAREVRPGVIEVPLVRGPTSGWWYVHARVNGQSAWFMLDTGASATALNAHSSTRLGYRPGDRTGTVNLAGGWEGIDFQRVQPDFRIGPFQTRHFAFQVMSIPPLNIAARGDGLPTCDGLIGSDLLHALGGVIDYPAGILTLHIPEEAGDDRALRGRWVCTSIEVGGRTRVKGQFGPATVDFRDDTLVWTRWGQTDRFRLEFDPRTSPGRMTWHGDGSDNMFIYKVEGNRLTLAGELLAERDRPRPADARRVGFPTAFRTEPGDGVTLLTFEKEP